jgi:ribulose-phosphate 3-epimerase
MDGRFVPNISMGPLVVEAVRRVTSLPLDVHLMIVEPERYVDAFVNAGAHRISVHVEASPNLHRTLQQIREAGCQPGVAINPHTPASALSEVIDLLDVIIVMTVNPGFGGQQFIPSTMPKLAALRAMAESAGRSIDFEVDGGIGAGTALTAVQSGANVLIAGTAIFSAAHSVADGVRMLRASLD